MKIDINMGTIWTMMVGLVMAVMYMFNTFATASELKELATDIHYASYYTLYDRIIDIEEDETVPEKYENELKRRLERLKAKICAEEPEWEQCDGDIE